MDPTQIKTNLTFNDLSDMTDQWISDVEYCKNVFQGQCEASNRLQEKLYANRCGLEEVNRKLNYLKCVQDDVDLNVRRIDQYEKFLEMIIENVEKKTEQFEGKTVTDECRQQMYVVSMERFYKLAEELNSTLKNYEEICEETLSQLKDKFEWCLDQPLEAVAQIMMSQLDILEQIELKIQHIRNMTNINGTKLKLGLHKYRLKENKRYM